MSKRFSRNEPGMFFTAALLLILASWQVSFDLGTCREIFFPGSLTIWIASVAALFGSLVIGQSEERERWGTLLLLLRGICMTHAFRADLAPCSRSFILRRAGEVAAPALAA